MKRITQFSVRTLLVVVAVLCVLLAVTMERARRQRAAVSALRAAGASVFYEHEHDGRIGGTFQNPLASPPSWAERLLGEDFFHNVVSVYYGYGDLRTEAKQSTLFGRERAAASLTAEQLTPLKIFPRLKTLAINQPVSDEGYGLLSQLSELTALVVPANQQARAEKAMRPNHPKMTVFLN